MADYIRREDALKALQNNFYSTAMDNQQSATR